MTGLNRLRSFREIACKRFVPDRVGPVTCRSRWQLIHRSGASRYGQVRPILDLRMRPTNGTCAAYDAARLTETATEDAAVYISIDSCYAFILRKIGLARAITQQYWLKLLISGCGSPYLILPPGTHSVSYIVNPLPFLLLPRHRQTSGNPLVAGWRKSVAPAGNT